MKTLIIRWLCAALLVFPACESIAAPAPVMVREENIVLPTYAAGEPDPNPMFFFGRQSQGAEGRVYPYSLYDSLTHVKSDKTYRMVYLENEYIRIGVLPELGGRLFEAVDKSNNYDFVYRQHVVKPALIGLIGAWMSGGIEWNIPHHHRASTFLPTQYRIEENADGSKTVWVGELEVRQRMRWAVGYTIWPGKSYLTAKVRIVNRTPLPYTMLCFANVAVHAGDGYQIIFPPDTQYVTYHHKIEFAKWPVAEGRYRDSDFGGGTDVSRYANHANANSMFAWNDTADFFAGYDHGKEAGTMSVADHHIVPGKKFWTWGSGPRGRMWDKILTDSDGPYIELMTGAYSDNQPDYSWLQPFEAKSFDMHWYPFRDIGGVKNANLDAAVNLEVKGLDATVGFYATSAHQDAIARLTAGDQVIFEDRIVIDPGKPFGRKALLPPGTDEHDLRASLVVDGKELIAYSPVKLPPAPMPEAVKDPVAPKDLKTVEELYLVGQRIEQFHDAGREPEPYWEEAFRRDPGDVRVNTALGIRLLKSARFADAEKHFRKALERLTAGYTSPRDGEPFYYLGLALKAQGDLDGAFDAFYKATWSQAQRAPSYFALAEIATQHGDFPAALDYVDRSLNANSLNIRALTLKASLLRHTGRTGEVAAVLDLAAQVDPLDVRAMAERWLAGDNRIADDLSETLRDHPANGLEVAAEYGNAGLWQDGTALLSRMIDSATDRNRVSPLAYYYLGQFAEQLGDAKKAADYRELATKVSPEYGFPFQSEAIPVLRRAMEMNPRDARAPYYLGNLLFDWQPDEAVKLWEQSAAIDPSFAIVHRNLAAAYEHKAPAKDSSRAIAELEKAVALPGKYAMHFAELDELYAENGKPPAERLALLEQNHDVVSKRDDSLSREIGLKVFAGKYDEAIQLMTGRTFSVWEGGTLEVSDHWVNAHLLRGQRKLAEKRFAEALADFQMAENIPDNLPSDGGNARGRQAEIAYWIGMAQEAAGQSEQAKQSWQRVVSTQADFRPRRNSRPEPLVSNRSARIYYQALARQKLGANQEAEAALKKLLDAAQRPFEQKEVTTATGEESGRSETPRNRETLARYLAGVAHLGLGETKQAKAEFESALKRSPDFLPARTELSRLQSGAP